MEEFRAAVRDTLAEMLEAAEEMIHIGKEITDFGILKWPSSAV